MKIFLTMLFHTHIYLMPVFVPEVSGVRNGHLVIKDGPRWGQMVETGQLDQPDGAMVFWVRGF